MSRLQSDNTTQIASVSYHLQSPSTITASANLGTAGMNGAKTVIGMINPGARGTGGIDFTGAVTTPAGFSNGEWNFLQTWRPDRRKLGTGQDNGDWDPSHMTQNATWGLDNFLQYPASSTDAFTATNAYVADGSSHTADDSPKQSLTGGHEYTMDDQFFMFLMFKPPGTESQWVPLRVLGWKFNVVAKRLTIPGAWALLKVPTQSTDAVGGVWTRQTVEPEWPKTHANNAPWVAG